MRQILFILIISSNYLWAQKSVCTYEERMAKQGLVDVHQETPSIWVELKYATTENFMKKNVYGCLRRAFLQKEVSTKLKKAQAYLELKHSGYHLLVYDAARPLAIQWILWNTLTQYPEKIRSNYVADPREHSIHNYGSAVDLTVVDDRGKALDMGTPFDYFGEEAYPSKEKEMFLSGKLSKKAWNNRLILRTAMRQAGFMSIQFEWWHFNAYSRKEAKVRFRVVP